MRAQSKTVVQATLRRQGISVNENKIKKRTFGRGAKVKDKDIAIFTRQLATMMRAGVPLAVLRYRNQRHQQSSLGAAIE